MSACPADTQLAFAVSSALTQVLEASLARSAAQTEPGASDLSHYDRRLEHALGEQERAVGALWQHRSEHGCYKRR